MTECTATAAAAAAALVVADDAAAVVDTVAVADVRTCSGTYPYHHFSQAKTTQSLFGSRTVERCFSGAPAPRR